MTGALWPAALAAALFAVHPLHVESVAWVSERKDVLSALLWMLTLLAYLRYVRRPAPSRYALVVAVFAAGLMAKPMLVTLPFVLLLLDHWPLNRLHCAGPDPGRAHRPLSLEKSPLVALAGLSAVITFTVQQQADFVRMLHEYSLPQRVANAVAGYGWYLAKTVWPSGLAAFYPYADTIDWPRVVVAGAGVALATAASVALWRRSPWLATGWFWYLGTLVPVIGLVQVGLQATADRYAYLPLAGIFLALAWAAGALVGRSGTARRAAATAAALAAIIALGAVTRSQLGFWRDSVTLFSRVNAVTGGHTISFTKLGVGYIEQQRYPEAVAAYREAIRLDPRYVLARFNLAMVLVSTGDLEGAVRENRALAGIDAGAAEQVAKFIEFASGGRLVAPRR